MKKLLHERLRNYDGITTCQGRVFASIIGCEYPECVGISCGECTVGLLDKFADEIEQCYIPRPRDNKGIPFFEGDTVYSIDPDTEYSAQIISVSSSTLHIIWDDGESNVVEACDMQHEKPQPKVYDADGVEIKVGDTVWFLYGDHYRFTVDRIFKDFSLGWRVADGGDHEQYFVPDKLTHKEPDSLEKLLKDMEDLQEVDDVVPEWLDRLSALIERGA